MVQDYTQKMYVPSMERLEHITSTNYELVKNLSDWKLSIEHNWPQIQIIADKTMNQLKEQNSVSGEEIDFTTMLNLGSINPSSVRVELYYGYVGKNNIIGNPEIQEMKVIEQLDASIYRYSAKIKLQDGGEYGYTFRVLPYNPELINKFDMGLIRWVVQ
jgi:starch phosphorylase